MPGYRRQSHSNKSIDESFITTVYAIPIAILNPYVAGGLLVDYLVRGHYHIMPKHPDVLEPEDLSVLNTLTPVPMQADNPSIDNSASGDTRVSANVSGTPAVTPVAAEVQSDPKGVAAEQ